MRILKRKILLALSLPIDFFKSGRQLKYRPYNFLYFLLPGFRQGSIRDAIGQLVKSGEIDKIVRHHLPYFRLTGAGRERLLSFFPISLSQTRVWDGKWRIIIKNDKCRAAGIASRQMPNAKLREFGFRKFSRGVYMTPMPVSEKLKSYFLREKLLGKVVVFESQVLLSGDDQGLAKKIWKLEELGEEYSNFIKRCQELLKKLETKKGLRDQTKNKVVNLFNLYFSLLSLDPGLPKRVLPSDWSGDFSRKTFLRLFQQLENEKTFDMI